MARAPDHLNSSPIASEEQSFAGAALMAAINRSHLVVEYDINGIIKTANLNFLRVSGYTLDQLQGQHERLLLEDSPREGEFHRQIWAKLAEGRPQSGRYKRKTAHGDVVWLHITYSPIPGPKGRIAGVIACAIDVTEDELRRAELEARADAMSRCLAVIEYQTDGTITAVNDTLLRHTGYSRADLVGQPASILLPAGTGASQTFVELWQQLRAGQPRVARWDRIVKRGGASRVRATLIPVLNADGQVSRIFEYSAAGSKSVTIEPPIHAANTNFNDLFELCPVGMALTDANSLELVNVNSALLHQTGFSKNELLGTVFAHLTPPKEMRSRAASASGRSKRIFDTYERELPRRDGGRYAALVATLFFVDSHGRGLLWSIVQDISQRKAKEDELSLEVRTDKLTGLVNRTEFMSKLRLATERIGPSARPPCAVLFLDLDNFKLINDTLGHDAGDSLLRQFADRIRATIRTQRRTRPLSATNAPVIARFGGDEFAVLLLHLEDISEATKIGTRLAEAGQQPYQIAGREVQSTVSVGIVISVKAAESADQIMRNADAAMYESKRKGRQQSSHFSETMQLRLARQVALEDALRATVGTDAFSIDYQPIVDLTTNRMVSVEALLRWSHPLLGDVTPTEFVPIAENSGLILPIGDWVLREACRQFAVWRADAPAQCPNSISVNVSRAHLAQGEGLYSLVKQILKDFDLPPHCLTLEVTEREVMRYPEFSLQTLESIHKLGVKLAMDDFGTGASSLGCLRSYPFDTIKIDRSFLSDLERGQEARSVLNATVALVRSLGMKAVAEGIERETQLKLLKDMGVALGQGYYLGQPRPGATLLREVAKDRASRSEEHSIFLE